MLTTTQLETTNVKVQKSTDWAISSQASCQRMMKVQRLVERRRPKRAEMRGSDMQKRPVADRFHEKVKTLESGCQEWTGWVMPNGYGQIHHQGKTQYAHRVAYELHLGVIPEGKFVLHTCDNRKCVNPKHLWLGSFDDNMADMVNKSRQAHGSRNGHAKLTADQVREIRCAVGTHEAIARDFGVSQPTVTMIRRGHTWKYV